MAADLRKDPGMVNERLPVLAPSQPFPGPIEPFSITGGLLFVRYRRGPLMTTCEDQTSQPVRPTGVVIPRQAISEIVQCGFLGNRIYPFEHQHIVLRDPSLCRLPNDAVMSVVRDPEPLAVHALNGHRPVEIHLGGDY